VASILVLLFVTGLVSPPNNVDVMQYHMPRVLQWIQNESLAHFPTIYDNQNTRPYFTELLVLNLSVLSGSDYLANIVQLFAAVGTMIAVAGIVSLLGGGRVSQWVAALFTLTLPMSLLQMTTPKDDVMAGFWIAVLLYFVVLSKSKDSARSISWLSVFHSGWVCSQRALSYPSRFPSCYGISFPSYGRDSLVAY
jgi:hypothetical protein